MKMRMELGQGYAEYDVTETVVVGDRLVPSKIEVHFLGGSESPQPELDFTIEVQDGVPVCTSMSLHQRPGRRGITQSDLREIRLLDWIEAILSPLSSKISESSVSGEFYADMPGTDQALREARSATRAMRTERRKIDEKHLRRVAEVYAEHDVDAVALAFGTSYRSAARWVQKARQEGLL